MELTKEMMGMLAQPFPAEAIQWKPGATTQDKTRGLALAYVDLRHYIDRLNEVAGPDWSDDYEVQVQGTFFVVSWWLVLGALLFATLVGLLAGLYPAARAARLAPLDALRYE